jgi:hypothetical protein
MFRCKSEPNTLTASLAEPKPSPIISVTRLRAARPSRIPLATSATRVGYELKCHCITLLSVVRHHRRCDWPKATAPNCTPTSGNWPTKWLPSSPLCATCPPTMSRRLAQCSTRSNSDHRVQQPDRQVLGRKEDDNVRMRSQLAASVLVARHRRDLLRGEPLCRCSVTSAQPSEQITNHS